MTRKWEPFFYKIKPVYDAPTLNYKNRQIPIKKTLFGAFY